MLKLGDQVQATGGRSSGFDYLRIALSVLIVVWHTLYVGHGLDGEVWVWTGPLGPLPYVLVPSFFSLSGFLIAGSVLRHDLFSFLTLRVVRIVPALFCEVTISAFIIGPLLTGLTLRQYFASPELWAYLQNIVGYIHYLLPGVFLENPTPYVNIQLWTIPHELRCYIAIAVLAILGVVRRPGWFALLLAAAIAAAFLNGALFGHFPPVLARPEGKICVLAFLADVLLFLARDRIPYNWPMFAAAVACAWLTVSYGPTSYVSVLPVAYVTVWLGLQNPRKLRIVAGADYSYGVYLYGFPIQQAVYQLGGRDWYINLPVSLLLSFVAAYLSWTLVEAKVLEHRKPILARVARTRQAIAAVPGLSRLTALTSFKSDAQVPAPPAR